MATKTAKKTPTKKTATVKKAAKKPSATVAAPEEFAPAKLITLQPMRLVYVTLRLIGMGGPMIQHQWDEKAKTMLRDKLVQGIKTRERGLRKPEEEAEAAAYKTEDGRYGILMKALKSAIISVAHKNQGIEKTLVRKALFYLGGHNAVAPFENNLQYEIGEDMVRVGNGATDMRWRPYFGEWSALVTFQVDRALLHVQDFVQLVELAGSRTGLCEMRPEKGGDCGRFRVDLDYIRESATPPKV